MRPVLLRVAAALAVAAVVFGATFAHSFLRGRPWTVDLFYARTFLVFVSRHPELQTAIGISVPFSGAGGRLDDRSAAFALAEARHVERELEVLRGYDTSGMTAEQRLSRDVLEHFLADRVAQHRFLFRDYPVNQMFGEQTGLPDLLLNLHPLRRGRDARDYVRRLEALPRALDQVADGVRLRAAAGVVPPRFVLVRSRAQIDSLLRPVPAEHPLRARLAGSLDTLRGLERSDRRRLLERADRALAGGIVPAYRRLAALVDSLAATAGDDDGVWKLPDGDAYYDVLLRSHTTTSLGADSIHALGLAEVARIRGLIAGIVRRQGGDASDLSAAVERLRTDPRFAFPAGREGRAQVLERYRAILAEADSALATAFRRRPRAGLEVRRVPEFREAGSAAAYYQNPGRDDGRPGVFFANLSDSMRTVAFDMRALAFHEGIPGHHFQIAIAQELEGVPFFRTVIPFTAYVEGWALYAERVALEMGLHPTAMDSLGALRFELWRAARLVVDTGIHRKRWTRERAIEYMRREAMLPDAETEVERYIVMPGQACAYKVGELEILRLREKARAALGARFDLRDFHEVVLGHGALPLTLLERVVDEWIARGGRPAAG